MCLALEFDFLISGFCLLRLLPCFFPQLQPQVYVLGSTFALAEWFRLVGTRNRVQDLYDALYLCRIDADHLYPEPNLRDPAADKDTNYKDPAAKGAADSKSMV